MQNRSSSENPLSQAVASLLTFATSNRGANFVLAALTAGISAGSIGLTSAGSIALSCAGSASARPVQIDADPFDENAEIVPGAKSSYSSSSIVAAPIAGATAGGAVNNISTTPSAPAAVSVSSAASAPYGTSAPPVKASISRYQSRSKSPKGHGEAVLPMMVNLAMHPELMDAKYLRMILGAPDNKGVSGFGMSSLRWTAKDLGGPIIDLQSGIASFKNTHHRSTDSGTQISKTLLVQFPQSKLRLKEVQKQLGAPLRRYFDDQSHPVECYQLAPGALLTITEPANCFDIKKMAVVYNGPPLKSPGMQDYAVAAEYRLAVARRHLAGGNSVRCAELLNEHLKDQPHDAGAHLILAKTMRHYGDVNGSINEYRTALQLARTHHVSAVEQEAFAALHQLGLVARPRAI